ncbi:MAG: hypothetical protein IBJ03_15030 [Gemmatimonadaceae bacterium]|nr:hypothetical protein [Gemmatimonadaceae bacterium]
MKENSKSRLAARSLDRPLLSDEPLSSPKGDRFGIVGFARRVAQLALNVPGTSTMTIGVTAPWGSGKSTVLNYIEEILLGELLLPEHRPVSPVTGKRSPQPIVIRFSPWLYTDVNALTRAFFDTISRGLGPHVGSISSRASFTEAMGVVAQALQPAAKAVGVSMLPGDDGTLAVGLLRLMARAIGAGSKRTALAEQDVLLAKEKITRALVGLSNSSAPRRVVVLVDDLDRLRQDELLGMLKLLRLAAGLPNITYVVALDEHRVSSALNPESPADGMAYLEKFLQLSVPLPLPEESAHVDWVLREARAVLSEVGVDVSVLAVERRSEEYFGRDHLLAILQNAVKSHRDAVRVVNLLRVATVGDHTAVDFHAKDLLILCVVKAAMPNLYRFIVSNKRLLVHRSHRLFPEPSSSTAKKQRLDEIGIALTRAGIALPDEGWREALDVTSQPGLSGPDQQELWLESLISLFPNLTQTAFSASAMRKLHSSCRIESFHHFDSYFRFERSTGVASRADVERALRAVTENAYDGLELEWFVGQLAGLHVDAQYYLLDVLLDDLAHANVSELQCSFRSLLAIFFSYRWQVVSRDDANISLFEALERVVWSVLTRLRHRISFDSWALCIAQLVGLVADADGVELVDHLVSSSQSDIRLSPLEAGLVASLVVFQAETVARETLARLDSGMSASRTMVGSLWRFYRLSQAAGVATGKEEEALPIVHSIDQMLRSNPKLVGVVLSLAAQWSGNNYEAPSFIETNRSRIDASLSKFVSRSVLDDALSLYARQTTSDVQWATLVDDYLDLLSTEPEGADDSL